MALAELIQLAGTVLGPSGVAWLAVKHSLNGTRKIAVRTEEKVDTLATDLINVRLDVAAIKGQLANG